MLPEKEKVSAWYKEPWPWILMSGPIIVVIAALVTMYIAKTHGDSVVNDDYYKDGKHINLQMARDQVAFDRNIHAQVLVGQQLDQAKIFIRGQIEANEPIKLTWIHPTQKEWDESVDLQQSQGIQSADGNIVYTVSFPQLHPSNYWYVRLENSQWKIEQKWIVSQGNSILLTPINQNLLSKKK